MQQQQFASAQQNQTIYIQRMAGPGNMNRIAVDAKPQMCQHISLGNAQNRIAVADKPQMYQHTSLCNVQNRIAVTAQSFDNVAMSQTNVLPQQQSLKFKTQQLGASFSSLLTMGPLICSKLWEITA